MDNYKKIDLKKSVSTLPVPLILIVIMFFSLGLALLLHYFEPTILRDDLYYLDILQTWYTTGDVQALFDRWPYLYAPPLPIYLMLLGMKCGLTAEVAGWAVNGFLFFFFPLIAFLIARQINFSNRKALCAALLMSVSPAVVELSFSFLRDISYMFFSGWVILFLIMAIKQQKFYLWLLTGIFLGLCGMCRMEALAFIPVILLALLLTVVFHKKPWHKALIFLLAVSLGALFSCFSVLQITDFRNRMIKCYKDRIIVYWEIFEKNYF